MGRFRRKPVPEGRRHPKIEEGTCVKVLFCASPGPLTSELTLTRLVLQPPAPSSRPPVQKRLSILAFNSPPLTCSFFRSSPLFCSPSTRKANAHQNDELDIRAHPSNLSSNNNNDVVFSCHSASLLRGLSFGVELFLEGLGLGVLGEQSDRRLPTPTFVARERLAAASCQDGVRRLKSALSLSLPLFLKTEFHCSPPRFVDDCRTRLSYISFLTSRLAVR